MILSLFGLFIISQLQNRFGFSNDIFIALFVLFLAISGYSFSKIILKPIYDSKKLLDVYIKNTLHELNIPISTIDANLSLIEKRLNDEKDKKRVQRIKTASKNLKELYEELEYILKKESGKTPIDIFDIKESIDHIVTKFDDIKQDIYIDTNIQSKVIKSDQRGFEKAIENLISNAIKFNKKNGKVYITFKDNLLCIKDTGRGIETANLFTIFERYYKEDQSSFGHGIGLSIVKDYCDKSGIEIKIYSKIDQGTKICLNLSSLTVN